MKFRLAVGAVLSSLLLSAQSQPPPPTPGKATQDDKSKAKTKQGVASSDKSEADSVSAAINKLTSEVAAWKQEQAARPDKNDPPAEWWLKWSTIITALATFGIAYLAYRQWRTMGGHEKALRTMAEQMRSGLTETRRSAEAAVASADTSVKMLRATISKERARLRFSQVHVRNGYLSGGDISLGISLTNDGATKAFNVSAGVACCLLGTTVDAVIQPLGYIDAGDTKTFWLPVSPKLSADESRQVISGDKALELRGRATYVDAFGMSRCLPVRRKLTLSTGDGIPDTGSYEWEEIGDPTDNVEREEN